MGCDIHPYAEVRRHGVWHRVTDAIFPDVDNYLFGDDKWTAAPFDARSYHMFTLFAGVRPVDGVPTIADPRGLPADVSPEVRAEHGNDLNWHSTSWLTLGELLGVDYDQERTAPSGEVGPLREWGFGDWYFDQIKVLQTLGGPGEVRIVFWFDN